MTILHACHPIDQRQIYRYFLLVLRVRLRSYPLHYFTESNYDCCAGGTVDDSKARKLAADFKRCPYYETCAAYGYNIERVFQDGNGNPFLIPVLACIKILQYRAAAHNQHSRPISPQCSSVSSTRALLGSTSETTWISPPIQSQASSKNPPIAPKPVSACIFVGKKRMDKILLL